MIIMTRKKKLNASLEGLFSKSGSEAPASKEEPPAQSEGLAPVNEASAEVQVDAAPSDSQAVVPAEADNNKVVADKPSAGGRSPATRDKDIVAVAHEKQLVVFSLANEYYGLDITVVESIIRMEPVTVVPHAPMFIEGVINMRGEILPVVELSRRFGLPKGEETKETRIIVVEVGDLRVGMVVDAVTEVLRVSEDIIEPPSALVTSLETAFISGIAKIPDRLVILLDLEKILSAEEKAELSSVPAAV